MLAIKLTNEGLSPSNEKYLYPKSRNQVYFNNPMIVYLLGHIQVETTARYDHLSRDSVR